MNAMGRKYPFGQKMKRRGHFHIGAHNTKYILLVCTQKVKHICTKIKETSGNFPAIWQTPGRAFSLTTEKPHDKIQNILSAGVVELVDSVDLGSSGIAVQVRVLSPAPKIMAALWVAIIFGLCFRQDSNPSNARVRWTRAAPRLDGEHSLILSSPVTQKRTSRCDLSFFQ